jgi:hypothetical protein
MLVSRGSGSQRFPEVVSDDSLGAIVVWEDSRAGNVDLYAQRVFFECGIVAVETPKSPAFATLGDASPNPTRGSCALDLVLSRRAEVEATVLDVGGRSVRPLRGGERLSAGSTRLLWDGRTGDHAPAAPGLYFVVVRIEGRAIARKVVLAR